MPTRKVGSGALAGALSIVLVWVIQTYGGQQIPAEVASAGTTILSFIVSWLVPEAA